MRKGIGAAAILCMLVACRKPAPKAVVPDVFKVKFETSQGDVVVEATRAWSPRGVDRFHELVRMRYFDQGRFFRVVPGFIAQFGVHRDFKIHEVWREVFVMDDPPKENCTCAGRSRSHNPGRTRELRKFSLIWRITPGWMGRDLCRSPE